MDLHKSVHHDYLGCFSRYHMPTFPSPNLPYGFNISLSLQRDIEVQKDKWLVWLVKVGGGCFLSSSDICICLSLEALSRFVNIVALFFSTFMWKKWDAGEVRIWVTSRKLAKYRSCLYTFRAVTNKCSQIPELKKCLFCESEYNKNSTV